MIFLSPRTTSTDNRSKLPPLVISMFLLFSGAHAIAAETTVIPDSSWSPSKKEHRTWTYVPDNDEPAEGPIKCDANKVMIGRFHDDDEEGPTKHLCASLTQNGQPLRVITSDNWDRKIDHENILHEFQCSGNGVMTGRGHWHDEEEATWYFCGIVKDAWGDEMQVGNRKWSEKFAESWSSFTCPAGTVMTGRSHGGPNGGTEGDENGPTRIQCATLY